MQMPVTVPDITSELEQAAILEELRTQRLALAEWWSGLDIVKHMIAKSAEHGF